MVSFNLKYKAVKTSFIARIARMKISLELEKMSKQGRMSMSFVYLSYTRSIMAKVMKQSTEENRDKKINTISLTEF